MIIKGNRVALYFWRNMNKGKIREIAYVGMFSALLVISAWINIPILVPFTMQTFMIALMVLTLGVIKSLTALTVYVFLGIAGVPVFAGFKGGIGVILGPTGGFIIGFYFFIIVSGIVLKWNNKTMGERLSSLLYGLVVLYAFGLLWFEFVFLEETEFESLWYVLFFTVVPYIIPDVLKLWLACLLYKRIGKLIK